MHRLISICAWTKLGFQAIAQAQIFLNLHLYNIYRVGL